MNLSESDHELLDQFLNRVLALCQDGKISIPEARADIAEAVSLIANGNENFRDYMRATREDT